MLVERLGTLPAALPRARNRRDIESETIEFAQAALANAKHEGLRLAVRTRYIALAVIACILPVINPNWEVIYYIAILGLFALIGWAQQRVGRLGVSRVELALLFCDLALLTFISVVPNPWTTAHWPLAMQYHLGNFIYFFVLLSGATLAYSWRTVIAVGTWTSSLWIVGLIWVWFQPDRNPELTARIAAAVGDDHRLLDLISPNSIVFGARVQEIVVFLIAAVTLAIAVRRANDLLIHHASVERARTNLARYFSPNVVEELSRHDEPLKQVRTQNVAVLFVDIVGFTAFAEARTRGRGGADAARVSRAHGAGGVSPQGHARQISRRRPDGDLRNAVRGRCRCLQRIALRAGDDDISRCLERAARRGRRAADPGQLWPALRAGRARRYRAHLS